MTDKPREHSGKNSRSSSQSNSREGSKEHSRRRSSERSKTSSQENSKERSRRCLADQSRDRDSSRNKRSGKRPKKSSNVYGIVFLIIIILLLIFIGLSLYRVSENKAALPATPAQERLTTEKLAPPESEDSVNGLSETARPDANNHNEQIIVQDGVVLKKFEMVTDYQGRLVIKGEAQNTTRVNLALLEIKFKLFDVNGRGIGEQSAVVRKLKAGFGWRFEAVITERKTAHIGFGSMRIEHENIIKQ